MKVEIDGQQLHYEEFGSGPNVLLLHGWGARIESWGAVPHLLSAKYRVIALDFPGFGQSPAPAEPWTVDRYTDCTLALMEHLHIQKTHIICHSFGGRVSIKFYNKRPDLVDKMVFTDAAGILPKRGMDYYRKVYSYKLGKKLAGNDAVKKMLKGVGVDVEKKIQSAGSSDYRQLPESMRKTFVHVVNEDLTPLLENIHCPTLLVWGENDQDTPLYMAKIMEEKIKDSGLVIFPGSGHFSYLDDIPRYVKICDVFFGG